MASLKMTFSIDEETARILGQTSERLGVSKSQVVREAVADYGERVGRLSERERRRLLTLLDEVLPAVPARPQDEVDAELQAIRAERRTAGRRPRN
ncbi:MAG: ribbon-helix-helix protein, CopG family [Acidobacteriota bacterium]|nr:ribbon-helix-helix protein, CopG family [Acidobacteriota bacterium]